MEIPIALLVSTSAILVGSILIYNVFFHPLKDFPGPVAAKATIWWRIYIDMVKKESMVDVLTRLHKIYGDVVRIGPNELHFVSPAAYHDIYNSSNRWDKERTLYEAFGVSHSSFGLLKYSESKPRKDALQTIFSRRAILSAQEIIRLNMERFAEALTKNHLESKSADLLFAFQSYALDNVTEFCWGTSVNAIDAPNFTSPMIVALNSSLSTHHLLKNFATIRKVILGLPTWLATMASPETAGLRHLRAILWKLISNIMANPDILKDSKYPTIYSRLLDPSAYKNIPMPDEGALLEEGQLMIFAGSTTVADALMTGYLHILNQPNLYQRLKDEISTVWPNLESPPHLETLETLPLLTATIRESLRVAPGVSSSLLRVVPDGGVAISGYKVPGGTAVGMTSLFLHNSSEVFERPERFNPDRWLAKNSQSLDQHLVAFSKGPRSCLGVNLAWCELYIALATTLRRFDMTLDGTTAEDLVWRDCFTPHYYKGNLKAWCKPVPT